MVCVLTHTICALQVIFIFFWSGTSKAQIWGTDPSGYVPIYVKYGW